MNEEMETAVTPQGAVGEFAVKCPTCGGAEYRWEGNLRRCTNPNCRGMAEDPFADLR